MQVGVDNVKGFTDYLPPESLKRSTVKDVIEKNFRLFGFMPIETPVVEYDEIMRSDNLTGEEDASVSDRFRLKDRAGRNLGLRYEFTFQLAKIFKLNPNIKLPFRRYQIGNVFRDEPIGADRFRQFTQCDIDIIGDSSIKADADCLIAVSKILKELNINSEINVNNRKLLGAIIESVEITEKERVMRELDKIDKIGEDTVKTNLRIYADSNKILTLFKLLEKPISFFKQNAFDGASEVLELQELCEENGIKIKFNPFLVRGLSYYTGNIFEIQEPGKGSIAGGGRYDKLVGKFSGKEIPAVGISFGLERVTQIANIQPDVYPKILIISIFEDKSALALSKKLREYEVSCLMTTDKPGKSLEYANFYQIPFVIFLGEDEVTKEKYKLKDMKSGEEKSLTEKQLLAFFGKKIKSEKDKEE